MSRPDHRTKAEVPQVFPVMMSKLSHDLMGRLITTLVATVAPMVPVIGSLSGTQTATVPTTCEKPNVMVAASGVMIVSPGKVVSDLAKS